MNILTQNNIKTMSSREIAELTNKKHAHVMRDIRAYVGAVIQMERGIDVRSMDWNDNEGVKLFGDTPVNGITFSTELNPQNKQSYPLCHLDKNTTLVIVSGYNVLLRKKIIERWQELEQQAQASQPAIELPKDYLSALKALVTSEEEKQVIGEQLAIAAPKAAALDTLSHVKGALGIRETAKAVGIPEREFVRRCLNKDKPMSSRFLYRDDDGKLNAYSHRIKQGFMSQKITSYQGRNGHNFVTIQVKFTAAGVAHVAKLMQNKPVSNLRVLEAV